MGKFQISHIDRIRKINITGTQIKLHSIHNRYSRKKIVHLHFLFTFHTYNCYNGQQKDESTMSGAYHLRTVSYERSIRNDHYFVLRLWHNKKISFTEARLFVTVAAS